MEKQMKDKQAILEFLLAGRARFSLRSNKTGKHYSYNLTKGSDFYTLKTLTNERLGVLNFRDGVLEWGIRLVPDSNELFERTIAFGWFLNHLDSPQISFFHIGQCGKCGRTLTDPTSIERGIGPECFRMTSFQKDRRTLFSAEY